MTQSAVLALIAGVMWIFYGPFLFFSARMMSESLFILLNLATFFTLLHVKTSEKKSLWYLIPGIFMGLTALIRPTIFLFLVLILVYSLIKNRKKAWSELLFLILGTAIIVSPAMIRNSLMGSGSITMISASGGSNFFIGNNIEATGAHTFPTFFKTRPGNARSQRQVFRDYAEKKLNRTLTDAQVSGFWFRKSFEYMTEHPWDWIKLTCSKFMMVLNYYEIPLNHNYYFRKQYASIFSWPLLEFSWLFPFALVGIFFSIRNPKFELLHLYTAGYTIGMVLFFVLSRYRLSIAPAILIYSVIGLSHLLAMIREKNKKILTIMAIIITGSIITHMEVLPEKPFFHEHYKAAYRYTLKDNLNKALNHYQAALHIQPDHLESLNNLATIFDYRLRQPRQANKYWENLLQAAMEQKSNVHIKRAQNHLNKPEILK